MRGVRLGALDGLRGLAALGIVLVHVRLYVNGDARNHHPGFFNLAAGELRVGVVLFFVLSGFLIYRPFVTAALEGRSGPSLGRYAVKRAARLLPAYYVALAGGFALTTWLSHPMAVDAHLLPRFLVFAQTYSPETAQKIDPPMWTLVVEVGFYVLVPFVALVTARLGRNRRAQLAWCLGLFAAGVALFSAGSLHDWQRTVTTALPGHLHEFAAGMLVAVAVHERRVGRPLAWALVLGGAALVVVNATWHARAWDPMWVRAAFGDLPATVGFALVVGGIAGGALRARALTVAPVRALGTLSYGVYLWHILVIYWLRGTDRWPETFLAALVTVLACTLVLATASWFCLERPAIRWAQAVTRRRAASSSGWATGSSTATGTSGS